MKNFGIKDLYRQRFVGSLAEQRRIEVRIKKFEQLWWAEII